MSGQYWIGLMSGTSLDGIDAALVEIADPQSVELIDSLYCPFSSEFQAKLKSIIGRESLSMIALGELDIELAELFADAANKLLEKTGIPSVEITGIASHGVTLFHRPEGRFPFTWQIADPNVIAARTDCLVVADFRRMDVAFGGQGAPLVPMFHQAIAPKDKKVAFVNIGGMANVSIVRPNQEVVGFDTGPGNVLMNEWIQRCKNLPFDENGVWASRGEVNHDLLSALLDEPYFKQPAPKSTGRELFNLNWLNQMLLSFDSIKAEDVQATLLQLSIEAIAQSLLIEESDLEALYVCGGGAQNAFLMQALAARLPMITVVSTECIGVHPDWVEAVAFAWLGYCRKQNTAINLSPVTGANNNALYGGIYKPS